MKNNKKRDARILRKKVFELQDSPFDERDYNLAMAMPAAKVITDFPLTYRAPNSCPILNQGNIGSCVAHAIATAMSYGEYEAGKEKVHNFSRGFIYGNRGIIDWKGEGMYVRWALKQCHKEGDVLYSDFPYNLKYEEVKKLIDKNSKQLHEIAANYKIINYFRLYTPDEIKTALLNQGAVIFSIAVYSSFEGNVPLPTEDDTYDGNHCMVIVGWDEDGWIFQNSWGKNWGEKGYGHLPYDYIIKECWGITIDPNLPEPQLENWFVRVWSAIVAFVRGSWIQIKQTIKKLFKKKEK